ncbi:MAG: thiamine pyrophosphate-dependent enzyme [Bacillota bacterium]
MFKEREITSWCPGCGNFPLRKALKNSLNDMDLTYKDVVMFTGIGQAAKMPHFLKINGYNGLHGRAIPPAVGMRIVNPDIKVIVESGDGCSYGEGGNHFMHNMRRNLDIVHLVHNNQIYGLTKGQASPTSGTDMRTDVQPEGVTAQPLNPLRIALSSGATFVARSFVGDREHLSEMIEKAFEHKGYALIDILQPCVSFNKINTYKWYSERVSKLKNHNKNDIDAAFSKAGIWGEEIPIGIFYEAEREIFRDHFPWLDDNEIISDREIDPSNMDDLLKEFQ